MRPTKRSSISHEKPRSVTSFVKAKKVGNLKTIILIAFACVGVSCARPASACPAVTALANSSRDATSALLNCIEQTPPGGRIELGKGRYTLRKQLRILKPVVLATSGVADSAAGCDQIGLARCATLVTNLDGFPNPNIMPIEVAADRVGIIHLVIEGSGDPKLRSDCSVPDRRPLGGGIRVLGSHFTLRKSVLRNFTCYTAMEVLARANALTIEDNLIGPNGDHRPGDVWSDGITIHDGEDTVVRRNRFVDNTDVQLILGGCRRCRIEHNRFRHTGAFARASFAELMLQAFPSTTGDYTGSVVTANDIDCGASRLCGYGIMVGANPWKAGENPRYPGAMFGGTISDNRVSNAMIGINIDSPTGPVTLRSNRVQRSGGRYNSDCGTKVWPSVNIAPGAKRFVVGNVSNVKVGSVRTTSCIINRKAN